MILPIVLDIQNPVYQGAILPVKARSLFCRNHEYQKGLWRNGTTARLLFYTSFSRSSPNAQQHNSNTQLSKCLQLLGKRLRTSIPNP